MSFSPPILLIALSTFLCFYTTVHAGPKDELACTQVIRLHGGLEHIAKKTFQSAIPWEWLPGRLSVSRAKLSWQMVGEFPRQPKGVLDMGGPIMNLFGLTIAEHHLASDDNGSNQPFNKTTAALADASKYFQILYSPPLPLETTMGDFFSSGIVVLTTAHYAVVLSTDVTGMVLCLPHEQVVEESLDGQTVFRILLQFAMKLDRLSLLDCEGLLGAAK